MYLLAMSAASRLKDFSDDFLRRHYPDQVAKGFISAGLVCHKSKVQPSTPISIANSIGDFAKV
ncbi:hypothetical protein PORCAN_1133 [Porphyromonas crevioricanis JCM 13913]|nr:hypothetical protein PORCAN_1133 [Porphyromonas crevioricanis JCM 13913]